MSRRRHTPEQVVRKLREADRLLGEGMELPEVFKTLEVSEQPVAQPVRRDEGRRRQALEGAGGGEHAVEADRRRSGSRESGAEGGREGTDESQVRAGVFLPAAARCQSAIVRS
jgi:hypothetical protein